MKMQSSEAVSSIISLREAPNDESRRIDLSDKRFAGGHQAEIYRLKFASAKVIPDTAAAPSTTIWSAVMDHIVDSFALAAVSMHPTALFSIHAYIAERNSPEPQQTKLDSYAPHSVFVPALAETGNDQVVLHFRAPIDEGGFRGWDEPSSAPVEPPSGWRWLASAWQVVVTLWTHLRNEWKIKQAVAALSELDDRTLRDLGIRHRNEIEYMVRYCREC